MKYKNHNLPVKERVEDLLSRMTTDEKIAQLVQVGVYEQNRQEMLARVRANGMGSRILAGSSLAGNESQHLAEVEDLNEIQRAAVEESRLGIPIVHGLDVIHGQRTTFPIPLGMAASFDPELVEETYRIAAVEASRIGIHWSFAPMVDIARDPRWGRIIEGYGEDPYLSGKMAAAAVRGFQGEIDEKGYLQKERILACAKHYIGYGAAEGGRDYNTGEISDNTLRNIYLPPFKSAVDAGVGTVMAAFLDINGEPATGSHYLLTELLKDELGFSGFVISDWASVKDLMQHRVAENEREAARIALQAGLDMEMATDCYTKHMAELISEGIISTERLDDAVRRILSVKFALGLFEHPYTDAETALDTHFPAEHEATTREIAAKGMVLLKNDGVLPLANASRWEGEDFQRIAVIGPMADQRRTLLGSWVNDSLVHQVPTLLESVRLALPQKQILSTSTGLYDEMIMLAAESDVVLLALGESNARNGEYNCVASLDLPAGQEALVQAAAGMGKPVVAVVFSGRPVNLTRILPYVSAVLFAWHPGSQGATAVVDILLGKVNPSGKLPISYPRAEGQIPVHYNAKSTGRTNPRYLDMPVEPLFPFGFGLSYSHFEFSNLALSAKVIRPGDTVSVSMRVTNTGERAGDEVVQCYIQDCVSQLTRPVRELKGFQRIHLQPGDSQEVIFKLGINELSYYGPGGKWTLEPGQFKVWVGNDSLASLEEQFSVAA